MMKRFAKFLSFVKPKRRWAQFSLGTMLLALTVLCVWLADYVSPVRRLERQLRDPNEDVRELAAERLGYLGPEARSTTKSLLRATGDTSPSVRGKSVWALSRVSGRIDLLAPLLDDSDAEVCLAAAEGLLWLGDDPAKLVPTLLELDGSAVSVGSVFEALGPDEAAIVVPLLLDSLSTADDVAPGRIRGPASSALMHVALPAPTVVPALIERLGHARPKVRIAAAEQLLRLGASAKRAAPALRARLHDRNLACAAACAAALGTIDSDDKEFLSVLKRLLRSDDGMLGHRVAAYLWMIGPDAAEASDDLVAFLCEVQRDIGMPYYDVNALKRIGPPAVSALDRALKQALKNHDRALRLPQAFQEQLQSYGWTAKSKLQRALFDLQYAPDGTMLARNSAGAPLRTILRLAKVRILKWALKLASMLAVPESRYMVPAWLGMLGPPAGPAVPTLIAALDHADFAYYAYFQHNAFQAFGMIGKGAAPAVPRLVQFLDAKDKGLRYAALQALEKIGASDEAVRARLRPFLNSNDQDERAQAARTLAASGEPVDKILPILIELAMDPYLRSHSLGSTDTQFAASIASLGPAAVPDLILRLQNGDTRVRDLVAEALGEIGPAASDSTPYLIRLLDDDNLWDAAAEALGHIGQDARAAVPKLLEILEALQMPPDIVLYDSSKYEANEDDASEDDPNGYDTGKYDPNASELVTILSALRGIGAGARDAAPAVLKLANSDDLEVRHVAVQTLARIDPANSSLIHHLRHWLAEWERKSAIDDFDVVDQGLDDFADAVWQLGPRAEPLVPRLKRIMTTDPLVEPKVRCYAAFALAKFASHRQAAESYLKAVRKAGFSDSFECINLADALLQRIAGVEQNWTRLMPPHGVGP